MQTSSEKEKHSSTTWQGTCANTQDLISKKWRGHLGSCAGNMCNFRTVVVALEMHIFSVGPTMGVE